MIVRREVSAQGRSRAFVDGALVTSTALRELSGAPSSTSTVSTSTRCCSIPSTHLEVLDAYAGLEQEREEVAATFAAWQKVRAERDRLLASQRESASRAEFVAFQLAEIDRVAAKPGEDDELMATRQVLANADKLQRLCADAYQTLYEGDHAALASLGVVWRKVGELAAIDERFAPHLAARDAVKPALEDLAYFLRSYSADIDASPSRLQESRRPTGRNRASQEEARGDARRRPSQGGRAAARVGHAHSRSRTLGRARRRADRDARPHT